MLLEKVNLDGEFEHRDRNSVIRIDCSMRLAPDMLISMRRERVLVKDGKVYHSPDHSGMYVVSKKLSEIKNESITLPETTEYESVTLTAEQIALAMEMLTDRFAQSE